MSAVHTTADERQKSNKNSPVYGQYEQVAPREREPATDRFIKNAASSVGRQLGSTVARSIGNAIIRGILGGLTRK